jgi:hypothetical protein
VSRLFGKLDAQRQRISGKDGVWAIACAAATELTTPAVAPVRNFLRLINTPKRIVEKIQPTHCIPINNTVSQDACRADFFVEQASLLQGTKTDHLRTCMDR